MKTINIIIVALFAVVFLSTNVMASEIAKNKPAEVASLTAKVQNEILKNLEISYDMNNTMAEVFFRVDNEGSTSLIEVKYPDEEKALQIEYLISTLELGDLPVKEGIYTIEIVFEVR